MGKQKVNKYQDKALPQATLDYHGLGVLTERQILEMAERFLEECHHKGYSFVSIIVGKGIHSEQGPVIGPLLRKTLPSLTYVLQCLDAPYTRGGSGALEIKLQR